MTPHCLICQTPTRPYFAKTYTEQPAATMMADIGPVEYDRCPNCGFVLSRTHAGLRPDQWARLNRDWHHWLEDLSRKTTITQPPYEYQAVFLASLAARGIIDPASWLDYAAGYGTLSTILRDGGGLGLDMPIYDPYVLADSHTKYIQSADLTTYQTVINSAMFEHVRTRADLDRVNDLVAPGGCLAIHTVVSKTVPRDPDWGYLAPPVHCAFHTADSMRLLMEQWGYVSSIYNRPAKMWVLFKAGCQPVSDAVPGFAGGIE